MATLFFNLWEVKCKDETGSGIAEWLSDEMYLGGFTVNNENETRKIPAFNVKSDFDDGETKKYHPAKAFASFNLGENFTKSKKFAVGLLLVEKDQGNLTNVINDIYDFVKGKITSQVNAAQARTEASGAVATAAAPGILVMLWPVIKAYVFSYVLAKVRAWFADDLFPLQDATATIRGSNHTWDGKKFSPISTLDFKGHDGFYQISYNWEIR